MPIYEYYCPNNHKIYQFYAKTLAQGKTVPKCPDNPRFKMEKLVSRFAVNARGVKPSDEPPPPAAAGADAGESADDARMEAAMGAMEREFANVDEDDPRAMGRMMRRMSELTGEKLDGEMEEVVRKLEEGADPDALEETMGGPEAGGGDDPYGEGPMGGPGGEPPPADIKEARARFKVRRAAPVRDPQLYDYE